MPIDKVFKEQWLLNMLERKSNSSFIDINGIYLKTKSHLQVYKFGRIKESNGGDQLGLLFFVGQTR